MDLRLQGKVALVTGSTSGIGEAAARQLAREGVCVVVHGRREAEVARAAETIRGEGGQAKVSLGDLSDDAGAAKAAEQALAAFGAVDIVVNNAGSFYRDSWDALDAGAWLNQYNTNVCSSIRLVKHLLPQMRSRKWGRFIQISSVAGLMPSSTTTAYGATKAAILAMTVGLAKQLAGSGITVNTVSPGPILTPMLEDWIYDLAKQRGWSGGLPELEHRFATEFRPNPTGRVGRMEEVADMISFLASPRADFINGANIRVDGGLNPTI